MINIKSQDLELINMIDHDATKIFEHLIPGIYRTNDTEMKVINEEGSLSDALHYELDKEKESMKRVKNLATFFEQQHEGVAPKN